MRQSHAGVWTGLARLWTAAFDSVDAAAARRHRQRLWRRSWLVSWDQRPTRHGGDWIARLSCPDLPITVERRGRSRCHALRRARAVLDRLRSTND